MITYMAVTLASVGCWDSSNRCTGMKAYHYQHDRQHCPYCNSCRCRGKASNQMDQLVASLEAKYGGRKPQKGKKRQTDLPEELTDEEFAAAR